jgi:aminomuconate-semialdehyde/2-hydroxymuconate-6-semialdehyde dehydrogenase
VRTLTNYIAGEQVAPAAGGYLDVLDPATGAAFRAVPASDATDVASAVGAAAAAFPAWSAAPASSRSAVLLRIADLIDAGLEELAEAESLDTGKPIALARSLDIPRASANFRFFATAVLHSASEAHLTDRAALNYTIRRPEASPG